MSLREDKSMEKLLYYAAQNEKKAKLLLELSKLLGIELVEILPIQSGQKLGYLAGVDGFTEEKLSLLQLPPFIPEEVLIFCGLKEERLDSVLGMLRTSGLAVSLKAVLTRHNVNWTLAALYQELCAERAQFQKK